MAQKIAKGFQFMGNKIMFHENEKVKSLILKDMPNYYAKL